MTLPPRKKPLARSPLVRKKAKKRVWKTPRCGVRGCKKPREIQAHVAGCVQDEVGHSCEYQMFCRSHAKAEADRRFSLFIRERDGRCMFPTESACVGPLQCCHILSRRFLATRYDPDNAVAGCAGHHAYWTRQPDRWQAFLETWPRLRSITLHQLRLKAFDGEPADLASVLAGFTAGSQK